MNKEATVLLPDFPLDELEIALRSLGFKKILHVPNGVPVDLDGVRVLIAALTAPSDGPLGDSALAVDDGTATILNQNDARPVDFDPLKAFAGGTSYDGHFLQFSGAIWWPMVYDLPEGTKRAIAAEKRQNGMERALRYVEKLDAAFVFPNAGPPCFLDDDLRHLNDVDRNESSIFPDQSVFLDYLSGQGLSHGRLLIPGSTAELNQATAEQGATCIVHHPIPDGGVAAIFDDKATYLDGYAERQRARIAKEKAAWPAPDIDVLACLQDRMHPLLDLAEHIRDGIGFPVELLVIGDENDPSERRRSEDLAVVIDFPDGVVRTKRDNERCRYRFRVARPLIERLLANGSTDWSNSLFLSMRFEAHRAGAYNEYLYIWFKSLSVERFEYSEGWYASLQDSTEETTIGEWCLQRRCPHLRADLSHFGVVHDTTLTCRMHGWQWDLETGTCLTSAGHPLRASRNAEEGASLAHSAASSETIDVDG